MNASVIGLTRIGIIALYLFGLHLFRQSVASRTAAAQESDKNDAAVKADLAKLQGVWYHLSREEKGKQVAGEDKEQLFVFRGKVVVLKKGTEVGQVGFVKNIDALSKPKKFDLVITDGSNEGMTVLCIYEIKDGVFRYCGGVEARPASFNTSADAKSYVYCSSYKRVKR